MARLLQKTFTFTDLVVGTPVNFDVEINELNLGASVLATGLSASDSDYEIVQSNDGENWHGTALVTITDLENDVAQFGIDQTVTMRYLGFNLTSAGTETSGTIVVKLQLK